MKNLFREVVINLFKDSSSETLIADLETIRKYQRTHVFIAIAIILMIMFIPVIRIYVGIKLVLFMLVFYLLINFVFEVCIIMVEIVTSYRSRNIE